MRLTQWAGAAAALLCASTLTAGEISTGFMIGPKFDQRAFYVRSSPAHAWQKTYSGRENRRTAQGKMFGVRVDQALAGEKQLAAAIAALEGLAGSGVLLVSAQLQGAQSGHNAFAPDGTLKPEWARRLATLLQASDRHGLYVKLVLFHQNQDEHFDSPEAIVAAATNLADWLIEHQHRNVMVSIADGWAQRGWHFDAFVTEHLERLIDAVRERFQLKRCDYMLPVAVSADVKLAESSRLVQSADVLMVRGAALGMDARRLERPEIVVEEKDATTAAAAAERSAGWLYAPGPDDAALDRIAQLTIARPARGGGSRAASK